MPSPAELSLLLLLPPLLAVAAAASPERACLECPPAAQVCGPNKQAYDKMCQLQCTFSPDVISELFGPCLPSSSGGGRPARQTPTPTVSDHHRRRPRQATSYRGLFRICDTQCSQSERCGCGADLSCQAQCRESCRCHCLGLGPEPRYPHDQSSVLSNHQLISACQRQARCVRLYSSCSVDCPDAVDPGECLMECLMREERCSCGCHVAAVSPSEPVSGTTPSAPDDRDVFEGAIARAITRP